MPIDPIRRPWLLEAGEPLLMASNPVEHLLRFSRVLNEWGLRPERLWPLPLCAVPLPVPASDEYPDVRRFPDRWPGLNPAAAWHPLLWLPRAVTDRVWIPTDDGTDVVLEDDDTWAVKVSLICSVRGLYDEESGTWTDVLSTAGVDIDRPEDLQRVSLWLAGSHDPVLDGIDITEMAVDFDDPGWALTLAVEVVQETRVCSWALGSNSLLIDSEDLRGEVLGGDCPPSEAVAQMTVTSELSEQWFSGLPEGWATPGGEVGYWQDLAARARVFAGPRDAFVRLVDEAVVRLEQIRDVAWPAMEKIREAADTDLPDGTPQIPAATGGGW